MWQFIVVFVSTFVGCIVLGKMSDRFWIMLVDDAAKRRMSERPDD